MSTMAFQQDTPERVASALSVLDAGDRELWVKMAFSVKDALGEAGRDVWLDWSRTADNFDERAALATWKSSKAGGAVRAGTLFFEARQRGWHDDARPVQVDPAEAERRRVERAERDARAAAELEAQRAAAAERANAIWSGASANVADHPYVVRKGGLCFGALVRRGPWQQDGWPDALLTPIFDRDQRLMSIEAISAAGEKRSLRGGQKAGGFCAIGRFSDGAAKEVVVAEGVATAAACADATGRPAVAAFCKGNLRAAAEAVRAICPDIAVIVAADIGAEREARQAAAAVGGYVAVPAGVEGDGADFWDVWSQRGPDECGRQLLGVLRGDPVAPEVESAPAGDALLADFEQAMDEIIPTAAAAAPERAPDPADHDDDVARRAGFLVLGFDRDGSIFIYSHERRQVITTNLQRLSREAGLIELADLAWWEANFAVPGKDLKTKAAVNWIARIAGRRGVYEVDRIRGRGAWLDDGRLVFHLGDKLVVDGDLREIDSLTGSFVYEARPRIDAPSAAPLSCHEGEDLLRIARMFRWAQSGAAELLAGWLFLAPICGVLRWRPHVWIGAAPGAGKSTLMDSFVSPLLPDRWALHELGLTTEAALRQKLGVDARPVLLDEFEANTEADRRRIEGVLTLIRLSSSSGEISRGTPSGRALTFTARSMFLLASVGVGLHRQTDEDRITRLEIVKNGGGPDRWPELEAELRRLTRDRSIAQRLFARALDRLVLVQEAVDVFTREAGDMLQSQRHGDQYGTLLAGCWCLTHDVAPTATEARAKIAQYELAEFGAGASASGDDSSNALNAVLSSVIRVDGGRSLTVSQLIEVASMPTGYDENPSGLLGVSRKDADQQLQLHGIRVQPQSGSGDDAAVLFAAAHRQLTSLVADSDFATDLIGRLARLPGAWKSREGKPRSKVRFAGASLRYVSVPLELCVSAEEDAGSVVGSSMPRQGCVVPAPF